MPDQPYGLLPYLYLCGAVLFFFLGYVAAEGKPSRNYTNPCVLFCFYYALTYFVWPAMATLLVEHFHQPLYAFETVQTALLCHIGFGLTVFATFTVLRQARWYRFGKRNLEDTSSWEAVPGPVMALLAVLILLPAFGMWIYQFNMLRTWGLAGYFANRTRLSAGKNLLYMLLNWFGFYMLFYYVNARIVRDKYGTKVNRWIVGTLLVLAVSTGLMLASRLRTLFPVLMLVATSLVLRRDKPNRKEWAAYGAAIVLMATTAMALREVRMDIVVGRAIGSGTEEGTAMQNIVGFAREYEAQWWLIEHPHSWEPLGGATFWAALIAPIPRVFFVGDKPFGGGPSLKNAIRPGSYDPSSGLKLSSYTTGLPTEALQNFGYLGYPLCGIGFGIVLWGLCVALRYVKNPFFFALWLFATFRIVESLRAEILGTFAWLVMVSIPSILAFLLVRVLKDPIRTTPLPGRTTEPPPSAA